MYVEHTLKSLGMKRKVCPLADEPQVSPDTLLKDLQQQARIGGFEDQSFRAYSLFLKQLSGDNSVRRSTELIEKIKEHWVDQAGAYERAIFHIDEIRDAVDRRPSKTFSTDDTPVLLL